MKTINFVLPMPARFPIGGYEVVYEYADRLADKYNINIIYDLSLPYVIYKYPYFIRYIASYYILKSKKYRWYSFKHNINFNIVSKINDQSIPNADYIFATAWPTAYGIARLNKTKGEKYYLIQSYETWDGNKKIVEDTYRLGLRNIVITNWLKNKIEDIGGAVEFVVHNGINMENFYLFNAIENRNPCSIAMMYHDMELKGCKDGIKALCLVREKYSNIKVTFFSVFTRPTNLPNWIEFVQKPSKRELSNIYNENSIFLSTSWLEGFGLTGAEAMACGCALVTTDNGGNRDYVINQETALVSMPRDSFALAKNIIYFIENNSKRLEIAENGHLFIQRFSWKQAIQSFEKMINNGR